MPTSPLTTSLPAGTPFAPLPHASMLSHSVVSKSLGPFGLEVTMLLCPWDFSGKNTGVGCHFFFQHIFPTQGSNLWLLCLLHCRQILYLLSHREARLFLGKTTLPMSSAWFLFVENCSLPGIS